MATEIRDAAAAACSYHNSCKSPAFLATQQSKRRGGGNKKDWPNADRNKTELGSCYSIYIHAILNPIQYGILPTEGHAADTGLMDQVLLVRREKGRLVTPGALWVP